MNQTSSSAPVRVVILGASGYTGAELFRLLASHPKVTIVAASGESQAGKKLGEVYPHLSALDYTLQPHDAIDYANADLVFCCLPHATTQPILANLPNHLKIVDLSADFRLHDAAAYAEWYGHPHQALPLQAEAVYGLSEWYSQAIANGRLVANPGCYPTCSLLPLLPLVREALIEADGIIIDAMSGVTGAGRKAAQAMLFCEVNDGAKAYGVGGHRHVAEIEQEIGLVAGKPATVSFTAHLVPMSRGMSATIHASLRGAVTADRLREALRTYYAPHPFVTICEAGHIPSTHEVRGTNHCRIAAVADRVAGRVILVSVIDNLVKGASGQAVQNMNLLYGWPETMALDGLALFP